MSLPKPIAQSSEYMQLKQLGHDRTNLLNSLVFLDSIYNHKLCSNMRIAGAAISCKYLKFLAQNFIFLPVL